MIKNIAVMITINISSFLLAGLAIAATESDYVKASCKGKIEFILDDRTRVDCLTDEYAIEFDWASKWAESLGQSLHYSRKTGKKAGIVLIYKKPEDVRYYDRLKSIIDANCLDVRIWVIKEIEGSKQPKPLSSAN
jgi:hypothetical protein